MRTNYFKATVKAAVLAAGMLLVGTVMGFGQQQINLTAGPATATLPDGSQVQMWGYSCGASVSGSTARCAALNPAATAATIWSPVVITVPTGQTLQINLTNNLSFAAGTGTNTVPTSLVIVGQLGGGLGTVGSGCTGGATCTSSPDHSNAQTTTWPIADPTTKGTPPAQGPRVQSFSTEVAAGATTSLTWATPRPGTYLLESGTHPSIQGPMGLLGMVVVTTAPGATAGTAYPAAGVTPAVTYNADVDLLFSEIDPVQNRAVDTAVHTAGFSETMVWSGQPGGCGNPTSTTYHQCYPPAVNYTPLYYLINGVAFDNTHASNSLFPASPATGATGSVLVRLVNAGLRMHVPSIIGSVTGTPAAPGFALIAEDGNILPGVRRVQSEVFMAAGKTYDVMINAPPTTGPQLNALPVFDRELSLSGNATTRDAGMLAYITSNRALNLPGVPAFSAALVFPDTYNSVVPGQALTVSDLSKGVIANDVNVYGVKTSTLPTHGTVALNDNGTFTYTPDASWTAATPTTTDSFTYQANGSGPIATVTLNKATIEAANGIVCSVPTPTYTSTLATSLSIKPPGILSFCKDAAGYPLTVSGATPTTPLTVALSGGGTATIDQNGGFTASVGAAGTRTFSYQAQNSQGTVSASSATVTLVFPTATGLAVTVLDGQDKTTTISDYRWIIEEDRTFYVDPTKQTNPGPSGPITPVLGVNFHTSYMPVVAQGCTGSLSCESGQTLLGQGAVCDIGNGVCRTSASQETAVLPSQAVLDPHKRYYISVLPGDAANPFNTANTQGGHGMGGAPIAAGQTSVSVLTNPTPLQPAKLSVFVFEDDFPLNGEQDAGGGVDILATNEPGLGGFEITLFDDAGGTGDATGQPTYDMFNMPLSNSLAGTIDPATGVDACPISKNPRIGTIPDPNHPGQTIPDPNQTGIAGMIVTCPKYEADGTTLSPLAGQAVIANLYPGRYGVVATPAADRIARGEEWLQTNTLDGQKAHDSFLRVGEPSFFQEFGPAGYHVSIGFANPAIINGRKADICANTTCTASVTGKVTTTRMSRIPDERLFSSGSRDSFSFTQCYVSLGDPDGEDFAFTKCAADGTFTLSGLPAGDWRITAFDQWNDQLVDGLSTPVRVADGQAVNMGDVGTQQWQANISTQTFFDQNGNGIRDSNEKGLTLVPTNIRFRDGSYSNFNSTDLDGNAGFNEVFPLFNWYVIETDSTRYKNTGTHVVYDSGGPADGTVFCDPTAPCGTSTIGQNMANTAELVSLPLNLRVPGAVYCANADCTGHSIAAGPLSSDPPSRCTTDSTGVVTCSPMLSTGRIDPPWVVSEGWQGFSGQNSFLEFGKKPYAVGENGGIRGHVVYASTRPFDDPQLLLQLSWEPLVPHVTMNLYKEGFASDGVTPTLTLVDTSQTTSWDDWAQGFRSDGVPNMNCPGQGTNTGTSADLFYFTLFNQPDYLDAYNNGGTPAHTIPYNSQFKCYDGMHNWNQLQPAPYDGMYQFPSVTGLDPATGKPTGTNCTVCVPNPDTSDPYRSGQPMLPAGKYVVEVVVPPGYELVKEEDKNILIGDNYIAPVTQQFGGLGSIFIIPDQAAVSESTVPWGAPASPTYNANNPNNPTTDLGALPRHEGDTGSVESFWRCVGASRIVPDYISLFPQSGEVAPFAGATRNLCDRKEVTLEDQAQALTKFYIFSSTHVAAHFTGIITDDYTSEFDPFSPVFGEKFSPANLPISIRDFNYNEVARTLSDWWGVYDGLTYSTWEVNPPNPTGYAPTMMVTCMNDAGNDVAHPDPFFNPAYSQFCYEIPFMPGQTQYMDTPVVPTSAYAGAGYDNPDCAYPDLTPAIASVIGSDGVAGPWVSASGAGHTLTITALGDQNVNNYGYTGPSATTSPFNQKTVTRHYGFGGTAGTVALVGSDGVPHPLTGVGWTDTLITGTVPNGVPDCAMQQQAQFGGSTAQCGELMITAANGKQSVDTVTVTIGGKAPTVVSGTAPLTKDGPGAIQQAIDAAAPGDLIIVPQGTYQEMVLMWKPVRLQGVGAASSIIDANTHPAGKLEPWRRMVNCLFGLALNGQPIDNTVVNGAPPKNPYDPAGTFGCPWTGVNTSYFSGGPNYPTLVVDRVPLEGILGWDATINGNLAEMLQEPSLMGAYEGAAITVLSKGVNIPPNLPFTDVFGSGAEAGFPTNTTLLTSNDCANTGTNPYPSNFQCNPSSIDGLGITNSSQGGGGILVHGWGHNLQIANNRVYNNAGTLSGGMSIGIGEFPDAYLQGDTNFPGSCQTSTIGTTQLPYCLQLNVNVHHNSITSNSSIGDELFSATPAGAGGATLCTGADFYKFNFNWVCGNLSTGDGGGVAHMGFSYNGDIEHNTFVFNQSTNPTIPTSGGGILVMGAPPDGSTLVNGVLTECGTVTDIDCVPGLSEGAGPGLVINANLIMGNSAESGSGGGLRFQGVNGTDVPRFPANPERWYSVLVTNNIIADNVAGWDGAGVSLEDSLVINFINNTVISNDTTASAGVLFNTLGAPLRSGQSPPGCQVATSTTSCPQIAGLSASTNTPQLTSSFTTGPITCPAGHPNCTQVSYPLLYNDIFWQNRSFYIGVGSLGTGTQNQQNTVALFDAFTTTPAPTQPSTDATTGFGNGVTITGGTGACVSPVSYWDIGVRGDTGPTNHGSGVTLAPTYSILTNITGYGANNIDSNPTVVSQYCDGSRVPPEFQSGGFNVPPGVPDATVPAPIFSLLPVATVDEGNNWINMTWGPLSMTNPSVAGADGNYGGGPLLGNYALAAGSPAIDYIPSSASTYAAAPSTDFFGNARKTAGNPAVDAGAVESQPAN